MKTTLMIATVLAAGASAVYAQEPPAAQQVPPVAQQAPPVSAAAQPSTPVTTKPTPASAERINEVKVMENIFANAVGQGATQLARDMQATDAGVIPGSVIVTPAHARGIALDGYGVLFDVDVPLMNMSVVWTRRQMLVQNLRDQITEARRVRQRALTVEDQQQLDARIQLLTSQLTMLASPQPAAPVPSLAVPVANVDQPPAGSVVAQTTDATAVAPVETRSPDEMYSDAIKKALIDAMLNHSSGLMLSDDEWLTVAARDNGPTDPGSINNRSGIILRIKGGDLAAFRAGKLSRDEVLKKIELLEWR
jgi:hypothetical protein